MIWWLALSQCQSLRVSSGVSCWVVMCVIHLHFSHSSFGFSHESVLSPDSGAVILPTLSTSIRESAITLALAHNARWMESSNDVMRITWPVFLRPHSSIRIPDYRLFVREASWHIFHSNELMASLMPIRQRKRMTNNGIACASVTIEGTYRMKINCSTYDQSIWQTSVYLCVYENPNSISAFLLAGIVSRCWHRWGGGARENQQNHFSHKI